MLEEQKGEERRGDVVQCHEAAAVWHSLTAVLQMVLSRTVSESLL